MKKIAVVVVLATLAAAGAFADLALGLNGALYMDDAELEAATGRSVGESFQNGEGIYYGLMAEFMGKNMGLGLNYMASFYSASWDETIPMMDMDLDIYLSAHILGSKFVFDPFVEAGLGYIFKDYAEDADDPDPENPLTATTYWYLGAGVGLNIWRLGIYTKFVYHFESGKTVTGDVTYIDEFGNPITTTVPLEAFGLKPYKIVLGVKFIL